MYIPSFFPIYDILDFGLKFCYFIYSIYLNIIVLEETYTYIIIYSIFPHVVVYFVFH